MFMIELIICGSKNMFGNRNDYMRLQKYMALCGAASRRKAEEYIRAGRVTVNSSVVRDMGIIVEDKDIVTLDGKVLKPEKEKVYILLNKPQGYISTANEQFGRPSVLDLVGEINERIYPVGRLDYDTSGLMILTNDGDFTSKITHPSNKIQKIYEAKLRQVPTNDEINAFKNGLKIDDYITSEAEFEIVRTEDSFSIAKITIHEGRNRQVRKMCETIGYPVLGLKRVQIGPILINGLSEGKWRHLNKSEVSSLLK